MPAFGQEEFEMEHYPLYNDAAALLDTMSSTPSMIGAKHDSQQRDNNMNSLYRHPGPPRHTGALSNTGMMSGGPMTRQHPGQQNYHPQAHHHPPHQQHMYMQGGGPAMVGSYGNSGGGGGGGTGVHYGGGPGGTHSQHQGFQYGSGGGGGGGQHHYGSAGMNMATKQQQQPSSQGGMNYRQYRDTNARRYDSPSKPQAPPTRNLLDEIDDVNNHGGNYGDDRIQNELLSEICGDIGIDEAMDLDIFDFDAPSDAYFYNQGHTRPQYQSDLDLDAFSDFDGGVNSMGNSQKLDPTQSQALESQSGVKNRYNVQSNTTIPVGYGTNSYQTKVPSTVGLEKGEYSPYSQSVPSVKSTGDISQRDIAIDSPTVSSSVPTSNDGALATVKPTTTTNSGSGSGSGPSSMQGSVGSPSVHSTTPSLLDPYESIKPPSSASMDSGSRAPGSVESVHREPSPALSSTASTIKVEKGQDFADSTSQGNTPHQRIYRSDSVGSPASIQEIRNSLQQSRPNAAAPGSKHSSSMDNLMVSSSETLLSSSAKPSYHSPSSFSQQQKQPFTCHSQPASPSKARVATPPGGAGVAGGKHGTAMAGGMHKAHSMNDNLHRQAVTKLQAQMSYSGDSGDLPHTDDQKAFNNNAAAFKVPAAPTTSIKSETPVSRNLDQGYFSQASTSSMYGSTNTLATTSSTVQQPVLAESKDKVRSYLNNQQNRFAGSAPQQESPFDISSHPSTADLNIPAVHSENQSASSSQSNSPTSMHIAKRARVINTGNDLLADVREQFSYVKGADMFAPPSATPSAATSPMGPRRHPGPYGPGGYPHQRMPQLNMQVPSQFNFGSNPNMGFGNNGAGGMPGDMNQGNINRNNNLCGPNGNNAEMYPPGINGPQRPNSGFGPNSNQPGIYPNSGPNNMYPSQSQSQAFNAPSTANQSLGMSATASGEMNMNTHPSRSMGPGLNPGALQGPQTMPNVNMDMQNRMGPMAHNQYNNNAQQNFMNAPNQRGATPKLDSMGNPYPNTGNFNNGMPPNQYPNPPNSQSQYGPSHGPAVVNGPGQMGYRPQSPNFIPPQGGNPNMNSMGQMMPGGPMNMHAPNMPMNNEQYGADMSGPMGPGPNNPSMLPPDGPMPGGGPSMGHGAPLMGPGPMGPNTPGSSTQPTLRGKNGERLRPPPEGLMQQIISDRSSAFRSHPLFPLLRDLIIADMNFNTPSFPFQLIANLPVDFEKLLQNYLNRNPPTRNQQVNPGVEGVIMDALKYAHQSLIEKIQVKKQASGYKDTPKPLSAIEDFCERFDRAVKNSFTPKNTPSTPSKSNAPRTPSKSSSSQGGAAPVTPKKENSSKTDNEKAGSTTPSSKTATAGRNKVLPKEAVAFMLEWLREHQDNPYPNDDEKEMLINKTKLTINQINYWFTNARRRILPKWALQRYMEQQQHSPFGPRLTPM